MRKIYLLLVSAGLLSGCDKQARINAEKIEDMTQKIARLQQSQTQEIAAIQSMVNTLDKTSTSYFEKNHEDAVFFHTNTLYLILTVDRKIEAQLQMAGTERESDRSLAYYYHTNQADTLYFCVAQIENAMQAQEIRMLDKLNSETRRVGTNLNDEMVKQIKLLAPDETELARRKEVAAELAQIKSQLETINARLGMTNPPAAGP